jgi:DNA-binding response OmpR family regulator
MTTPGKTQETTKTILVVEDSRTQALHLQSVLERQGLQAIWASDGPQGVQKARDCHPRVVVLGV